MTMIYLDNNATTFLDPEVFAALHPLLREGVGNPSSIHQWGQRAKGLLLDSHRQCAHFFGVAPDEMIFTSGATEGLNLLLHNIPRDRHVITSSLEHAAVIEPLKGCGASVTYLDPLPGKGSVCVGQVKSAIQENTGMIIFSVANNETGIKTEIEAIAQLAEEAHIPFVVDGVSLLGKASFHLPKGVSAACFSGHKIHAPQGIGVAIVKKPFKASPLIVGGPQQRGLRAGTENLPGIVGFTKALTLLDDKWIEKMATLRDRLEEGLLANLDDVVIHGKDEPRICNTSNIAFLGVDGETLLMALDLAGLAASHGSACSSGALEPSRVLLHMGIDSRVARSSLRFSLSRFTTQEEIERSITLITQTVKRLRQV
jgi:cysteine desulfurase